MKAFLFLSVAALIGFFSYQAPHSIDVVAGASAEMNIVVADDWFQSNTHQGAHAVADRVEEFAEDTENLVELLLASRRN